MITRAELKSHIKHTRPGVTSDEDWGQLTVIKEYEHLPIEGKRVMDVGANIGAFTIRALLEGAEYVVAYEPEASNYEYLKKNLAPFYDGGRTFVLQNAALTNEPSDTKKDIWLTGRGTMGSSSMTEFRGRIPQEVRTINFMSELDALEPDSIKMDCEGSEWELLGDNTLPEYVKDVVAELHFTKRYWREKHYDPLLLHMKIQGFDLIREPRNTGKNFHTLAHWRRS